MINPNTPDILKTIVESKKSRVLASKKVRSQSDLEQLISEQSMSLNFAGRLMGNSPRIIAEVKKASPSKGLFVDNMDALIYIRNQLVSELFNGRLLNECK